MKRLVYSVGGNYYTVYAYNKVTGYLTTASNGKQVGLENFEDSSFLGLSTKAYKVLTDSGPPEPVIITPCKLSHITSRYEIHFVFMVVKGGKEGERGGGRWTQSNLYEK